MTVSRSEADDGAPPTGQRWPVGLIVAIVIYGWAAVGALPYSYWLRHSGSTEATLGELLAGNYGGWGALFYSLPAALGAWLLARHSRHAVWPGLVVVGWVAWRVVVFVVHPARSADLPPLTTLTAAILALFVLLLWLMVLWRSRGLLT